MGIPSHRVSLYIGSKLIITNINIVTMKMYIEYLIGLEHYSIEALYTLPHLVFPTILEVILLLL